MTILYKAYEWIKDAQDKNSNQENDFYFAPTNTAAFTFTIHLHLTFGLLKGIVGPGHRVYLRCRSV